MALRSGVPHALSACLGGSMGGVSRSMDGVAQSALNSVPQVSVVIPAYNEERWIGCALGSLGRQTHPSFEVIVIDDGSTDRTGKIAAGFGVRLFRTSHRGAGAARDYGAKAAEGAIVVFLDADDVYATDFLEQLTSPLEDPNVPGTWP